MYFDRSPDIVNLSISGMEKPLELIIDDLAEVAKESEAYLVVNSHRYTIDPALSNVTLIGKYDRPYNGPSLMMYKIDPQGG